MVRINPLSFFLHFIMRKELCLCLRVIILLRHRSVQNTNISKQSCKTVLRRQKVIEPD